MSDANLGEVVTTTELYRALNEVSLEEKPMRRIKLSNSLEHFNGNEFYEKYKNAEFLKEKRNIGKIFTQGDDFAAVLNTMKTGEKLVVERMFIEPGVPLVITKSESIDESDVSRHEFTYRRLTGLTAAYVWNNIDTFETIYASEPEALGLHWTNSDWKNKLYLSAISGTEFFESAFEYIPFICAVKKYSLKLISENMIFHIASLPHTTTGEPMAVWYRRIFSDNEHYGLMLYNLYGLIHSLNKELKNMIQKDAPASISHYLRKLKCTFY